MAKSRKKGSNDTRDRDAGGIERRIYFFRTDCGFSESGERRNYDYAKAFKAIDRMSSDEQRERFNPERVGDALLVWVEKGLPIRFRMGWSRHHDFPLTEERGELAPLELPSERNLAELTHAVVFDDGFIGCEYNHRGPRLNALIPCLDVIASSVGPSPKFTALLRLDALQDLNNLGKLTLFRLRLRRDDLHRVRSANPPVGRALDALAAVGNSDQVEVIMQTTRDNRDGLGSAVRDLVRGVYEAIVGEPNSAVPKGAVCQVRGINENVGKAELLDLFNDKLISVKRIARVDADSRAVDKDSAFQVIMNEYSERREELESAPEVRQ